jgi:hypothetical protein
MLSNTTLACRKTDFAPTNMSKTWLIDMLTRRFRPERCNDGIARFGASFVEELAAEVERKLLSERIPERIQAKMETLAVLKVKMRRLDEAERIYAELLFRKIEVVGRRHPAIIDNILPLARVCELQGKTEVAEDLRLLARQIRDAWDNRLAKNEPAIVEMGIAAVPHSPACQLVS